MFRKRILLASLLKPVNDARMYEKLGKSLAKLPELEVHLAGFATKVLIPAEQPDITLHPIFHFNRLSFQRVTAQWHYWRLLNNLQPQLLLVCTHELLLVSWLFSKTHQTQLLYDVQENYQLNLQTQNVYKGFLGRLLGNLVRLVERFTAPHIKHFLLAEASYAQELPFLGNKYTVLQNKFKGFINSRNARRNEPIQLSKTTPLKLLYTGTISRLYGTLEAISFTKALQEHLPLTQLTIIGYAPDTDFLKEVRETIKNLPFISLIGGDALVPHEQIIELERSNHIGLMPYHPHPSTHNCIPTKLYEYLANGLVVIAQQNLLWADILSETTSGICIDFALPIQEETVHQILSRTYYLQGIPKEVFWETEEQKLFNLMESLLQQQ